MFLSKSTRTVTDFDELAVRRDAAALRARFLRSYASCAWSAVKQQLSRLASDGAALARNVGNSNRQRFSETSAGSWTTSP